MTSVRCLSVCVAWLAVWLLAGRAHAEAPAPRSVVLLAPSVQEAPALRAQLLEGLRLAHASVVELAREGVDPVLAACRTSRCARDVAKHGLAAFVMLAKVTLDAEGQPQAIDVELVAADGRSQLVKHELAASDLAHASAAAFEQAVLAFELGDDALLRVMSTPVGALVSIDGSVVGITPSELRIKAGTHRVGVSLQGFVSHEREVDALPGFASLVAVQLAPAGVSTLEPPTPALAAGAPSRRASAFNYVAGAVLVVAALPSIVIPLDTLAREGTCSGRRDALGRCGDVVYFGPQSALLMAAGALSLATGVYLLWAAPFAVDASVSSSGAKLEVTGRM